STHDDGRWDVGGIRNGYWCVSCDALDSGSTGEVEGGWCACAPKCGKWHGAGHCNCDGYDCFGKPWHPKRAHRIRNGKFIASSWSYARRICYNIKLGVCNI